jgi:hypothetical protein
MRQPAGWAHLDAQQQGTKLSAHSLEPLLQVGLDGIRQGVKRANRTLHLLDREIPSRVAIFAEELLIARFMCTITATRLLDAPVPP